ncbi:MAG: substrate-binding domain-containing protein [Deltaproteobacteria bacterium]|nr:substrate-binding domain-containing protein [Deltaproteobacteria bacterium]MBK8714739.1 substrate-binding domain-containing protein [Deltaproteobacteria bacterium]
MRTVLTSLAVVVLGCSAGPRREVVQSKGSDTMVNLAQAWAEAFEEAQVEVSVAVSGGGSGTGIAALIEGTTDIANTSRPLTADEIADAAARRRGPTWSRSTP